MDAFVLPSMVIIIAILLIISTALTFRDHSREKQDARKRAKFDARKKQGLEVARYRSKTGS
jgi:hypothetical protein